MIKKCKVILSNDKCTVIDFDGREVQLPWNNISAKILYINFDGNQYTISSKEEYKALLPDIIPKKSFKKKVNDVTE